MTTRRDVDELVRANRSIVEMARRDLIEFVGSLTWSSPEDIRAALQEIVPVLVREYGNLASAVAAEWYESMRMGYSLPAHSTALGSTQLEQAVRGSVGYATSGAFIETPSQVMAALASSLQRHVSYSTRDTIRRNVARDPGRPRYARVPTGAKTCAWCGMLASRGFVYKSEATAGDKALKGFGDDFHDDCDCQIVPEFDRDGAHIDGYDPDDLYTKYREARADVEAELTPRDYPSQKQIAKAMRRLYPDAFKDGVYPH